MPRKRGHNTGSFYQLPSGRWRAVLTVHHPDGTARRKYLERRTKREAMAAAAAYSAPCLEGQIKGNRNSMIYHVPGGRDYGRTTANVQCFDSEAEARAAGYRRAQQ